MSNGGLLYRGTESNFRDALNRKDKVIVVPKPVRSGRLKKEATLGMGKLAATADIERFLPAIRNPLLQPYSFYLPESRSELNRWLLYFYQFNPLFGACIDLHTELPLARFGLSGIEDPGVLKRYEEISEQMHLFENLVKMVRMFNLFGEVIPYAYWNESMNCFTSMTQIPGENVNIYSHHLLFSEEGEDLRVFELIPDDTLRQLVSAPPGSPYERLGEHLDPVIAEAVAQGKNILLNNFSTDIIARTVLSTSAAENIRGVPMGLRVIKDLVYEDKLMEAQYSVAEGHITPVRIWKIGGVDSFMPDEDYLAAFREMLIQADHDPLFEIVTHYAVNLEVHGSEGKYTKIAPELQIIENRILAGLMSNKTLIHGEGATYQNASVNLRILMARYLPMRQMFENYLREKIFAPIALANDFYRITPAELSHGVRKGKESHELMIPTINWRHKANLLDDANAKEILYRLRDKLEIPLKVLCDTLDLDYEYVKGWLQKEQGTVLDPVMKTVRENLIIRTLETFKGGISSVLNFIKSQILPTSQEEAEETVKKIRQVVPEGYEEPAAPEKSTLETGPTPIEKGELKPLAPELEKEKGLEAPMPKPGEVVVGASKELDRFRRSKKAFAGRKSEMKVSEPVKKKKED